MTARKVLGVACAVVVMGIAAACAATADGAPEIVIDRTPCAHCGMLISEPVFAAAYRVDRSPARVFDDIGCMVTELRQQPQRAAIRYWVHDAESGEWIDGATAAFVKSSTLQTPMGGGILAYRSTDGATRGAAVHQGMVIDSIDSLASPMKENER
jgi:copper chaperone NosL